MCGGGSGVEKISCIFHSDFTADAIIGLEETSEGCEDQ